MDREFVNKLSSVSEWEKQADKSEIADNSISFHDEEDGLIRISGLKGVVEYRLKPLAELFSSSASPSEIKWEDPRYLSLLYAIEGAIKRVYMKNPELTDSLVILALDRFAMKPEAVSNDAVIREITCQLRLTLSMEDYARDEVRKAARKILSSVKRHNAIAGIRGYLDFIMQHVP
jgi:hypothetical protein